MNPTRLTLNDLRVGALLLAMAVYACFSSPTPQGFGVAEVTAGVLLGFAAAPGAIGVLTLSGPLSLAKVTGAALLLYGLSVPLAVGVTRGHEARLIVRDIVPFLFLLMPVFLTPLLMLRPVYRIGVTGMAGLSGIAFALRLLTPAFIASHHIGFSALPDIDPLCLANAPTVLFTAIMAFTMAGGRVMDRGSPARRGMAAFALCLAGFVTLLAMAAAMQRASIGLMMVILMGLWLTAFARRPLRALPLVVPVLLAALIWHEQFGVLFRHLWMKTTMVGLNNRPEEAAVVFRMVGQSWFTALFGCGWGQTISDPAVGDVTVNYTHTLGTALWLKTGFAGVVLACAYLATLAAGLMRLALRHPVLACAIAAPCLIDVTLYASYKSLDFGVMLTLIPLWDSAKEWGGQGLRTLHARVYAREAQPPDDAVPAL